MVNYKQLQTLAVIRAASTYDGKISSPELGITLRGLDSLSLRAPQILYSPFYSASETAKVVSTHFPNSIAHSCDALAVQSYAVPKSQFDAIDKKCSELMFEGADMILISHYPIVLKLPGFLRDKHGLDYWSLWDHMLNKFGLYGTKEYMTSKGEGLVYISELDDWKHLDRHFLKM